MEGKVRKEVRAAHNCSVFCTEINYLCKPTFYFPTIKSSANGFDVANCFRQSEFCKVYSCRYFALLVTDA